MALAAEVGAQWQIWLKWTPLTSQTVHGYSIRNVNLYQKGSRKAANLGSESAVILVASVALALHARFVPYPCPSPCHYAHACAHLHATMRIRLCRSPYALCGAHAHVWCPRVSFRAVCLAQCRKRPSTCAIHTCYHSCAWSWHGYNTLMPTRSQEFTVVKGVDQNQASPDPNPDSILSPDPNPNRNPIRKPNHREHTHLPNDTLNPA